MHNTIDRLITDCAKEYSEAICNKTKKAIKQKYKALINDTAYTLRYQSLYKKLGNLCPSESATIDLHNPKSNPSFYNESIWVCDAYYKASITQQVVKIYLITRYQDMTDVTGETTIMMSYEERIH